MKSSPSGPNGPRATSSASRREKWAMRSRCSPVVPSRYGNRFAYGHVREACDVIVSGGLGCSIAPVRVGVPPEIVLVSLGSRSA